MYEEWFLYLYDNSVHIV